MSKIIDGIPIVNEIEWPEHVDRVVGMANSVASVQDIAQFSTLAGGIFTPPLVIEATVLKEVVESTLGVELSKVVALGHAIANLVSSERLSQTIRAVGAIIVQSVELVIDIVSSVTDILNSIPIVGTVLKIIGFIIELIAWAVEKAEWKAMAEEFRRQCFEKVKTDYCGEFRSSIIQPKGTSPDGQPTPADIFRPILLSSKQLEPWLPATLASMFVGLCGDAIRGPWHMTDTGKLWRHFEPPQYRGPRNPISFKMRRKMWTLIEGIMSQCRIPAQTKDPIVIPMGGQESFSFLIDMVNTFYRRGEKLDPMPESGDQSYITEGYLQALSNQILTSPKHCYDIGCQGYLSEKALDSLGDTQHVHICFPDCTTLKDPFVDMLFNYRTKLEFEFTDPVTGKMNWTEPSKTPQYKIDLREKSFEAIRQRLKQKELDEQVFRGTVIKLDKPRVARIQAALDNATMTYEERAYLEREQKRKNIYYSIGASGLAVAGLGGAYMLLKKGK